MVFYIDPDMGVVDTKAQQTTSEGVPIATPDQVGTFEEIWDPAGLSRFRDFQKLRDLVLRATQKALAKFHNEYFSGSERVLEVGSGAGFLRENWPDAFEGEWVELDGQPAFLREAKKRRSHGTFVTGSVKDLPFPDASFDVVCGYGSFDVLYNLESAVQEVERVLRPGGLFFHILDLHACHDPIAHDFKQDGIPYRISRNTSSPLSLLSGIGSERWQFDYIPEKKVAKFLAALGLSSDDVDFSKGGSVGYSELFDVMSQEEKGMYLLGPDPSNVLDRYTKVFNKYAKRLDGTTYFRNKLVRTLDRVFGENSARAQWLKATYRGKRTKQQKRKNDLCHFFEQRKDKAVYSRSARAFQIAMLALYDATSGLSPEFRERVTPACYEKVTLDLAVARKM